MNTYFGNIGIAFTSLWDGMRVTMGHFIRKKKLNVTLQYPHEKWPIPERYIGFPETEYNVIRSRLHVDIDDCIGCMQCQRACPVDCIKIETVKLPKDLELGSFPGSTQTGTTSRGNAKRLLVSRFDIDMAECMYCNLCTYPCPEECIYMVGGPNAHRHPIDYEFAERNRNSLVYQFATATDEEVEQVSQLVGVSNPRKAREERREKYRQEAAGEEGAGLGAATASLAVAVVAAAPAPEPATATKEVPAPEKGPAKEGEKNVDLAVLNAISDRIARSKAKAILNKALRQGISTKEAAAEIRSTLSDLGKLDSEVEAVLAKLES